MPAVLALDGGNSKTDVALVAADGTVLATRRGPGMPTADLDGSLRVISDLIGLIEQQARPAPGGPRPGTSAPAWPTPICPRKRNSWPRPSGPAAGVRPPPWSTTRSPCCGPRPPTPPALLRAGPASRGGSRSPAGPVSTAWEWPRTAGSAATSALGSISGDWGGGYGLGRAALWWAIRAEDGRGPATALCQAVPAHFGVPEVADVAIAIHQGQLSNRTPMAWPPCCWPRRPAVTRWPGTWSSARPARFPPWPWSRCGGSGSPG